VLLAYHVETPQVPQALAVFYAQVGTKHVAYVHFDTHDLHALRVPFNLCRPRCWHTTSKHRKHHKPLLFSKRQRASKTRMKRATAICLRHILRCFHKLRVRRVPITGGACVCDVKIHKKCYISIMRGLQTPGFILHGCILLKRWLAESSRRCKV